MHHSGSDHCISRLLLSVSHVIVTRRYSFFPVTAAGLLMKSIADDVHITRKHVNVRLSYILS